MNPLIVAEQFVDAINAHNMAILGALMTPDHRFTDSLGNVIEGAESVLRGWAAYFDMVPDYNLVIQRRFLSAESTDEIVLAGMAHGSYAREGQLEAGSAWSTPVALRAVVRDGRISEWHVYADNERIRKQMRTTLA